MNLIKKVLTPVSGALDKVCSALIVFMLGAMVVITGAQIVCRTWFTALSWSDEVTRYLLIWSTFLGASVVYRHNGHISVTLVQDAVSAKAAKALRVAVHVICLVLFAVLLHYSTRYCVKLKKTATAMPIKMKYIYSCIPVSMAIMMVHALLMTAEEATKEVKG
ncbi:MAG: TRAP transporter small permease [Clostridia bacterium]|nr:TRAP transporter small permease [Clostridia bacterium]